MTAVMIALKGMTPPAMRAFPQRRILRIATGRPEADRASRTPLLNAAADAGHFVYGTATGSLYGALLARRVAGSPVAAGVAYGLAVWAGSYLGWLPAVGLFPPPKKQSARYQAMLVAAHVVWGGTLGWMTEQLTEEARHERNP